mmetsp:Transcript_16361/g.45903  ORF Transcript_16361/g.45903 Transcript_16361/m.45903 type:complete len:255 (-) Transcript_16361:103-867(-)
MEEAVRVQPEVSQSRDGLPALDRRPALVLRRQPLAAGRGRGAPGRQVRVGLVLQRARKLAVEAAGGARRHHQLDAGLQQLGRAGVRGAVSRPCQPKAKQQLIGREQGDGVRGDEEEDPHAPGEAQRADAQHEADRVRRRQRVESPYRLSEGKRRQRPLLLRPPLPRRPRPRAVAKNAGVGADSERCRRRLAAPVERGLAHGGGQRDQVAAGQRRAGRPRESERLQAERSRCLSTMRDGPAVTYGPVGALLIASR